MSSRLDDRIRLLMQQVVDESPVPPVTPLGPSVHPAIRRRIPGWLVAVVAAAVVLVLVGGAAIWLGGGGSDMPVGTDPVPETTVPVAPSTVPPTTVADSTLPPTTAPNADPGLPGVVMATAEGWTRWVLDPEVFGYASVLDIVDTGEFLLAVGAVHECPDDCGPALWKSDNGIAWTRVDLDTGLRGGDGYMKAGATGEGGIVVVGESVGGTHAWYSDDGNEWARSDLPEGNVVFDVVAAASGYLAVGLDASFSGGAIWTSVDGATWTRVADPDEVFADTELYAVIATDEGIVVAGTAPSTVIDQDGDPMWGFAVWSSPQGEEWTLEFLESPTSPNPGAFVGKGLSHGEPGYIAGGAFGPVWFSADGQAWDVADPRLSAFDTTWINNRWVAALNSPVDGSLLWESTDGHSWTPAAPADAGLFDTEQNIQTFVIRPGGPGLIVFGIDWGGPGEGTTALWTWEDPTATE